jgi:hypothetical protein
VNTAATPAGQQQQQLHAPSHVATVRGTWEPHE